MEESVVDQVQETTSLQDTQSEAPTLVAIFKFCSLKMNKQ